MPRYTSPRTNKKKPLTSGAKAVQVGRFTSQVENRATMYCNTPLCSNHVIRGNLQTDVQLAESLVNLGWRIDINKFVECPKCGRTQ